MSEQDLNSKIQLLREIKAWETHPITVRYLDSLNERRKQSILQILEQTPVDEYQKILREQIIGEQRGQDLLRVLIAQETQELDESIAESLKNPN